MKQKLQSFLAKLQQIPGMVIFWVVLAFTVVIVVLNYLDKLTSLKGQQANLDALIRDAIARLKLKQNEDKNEALKKKPETVKDPKEVEDFYKKELK